MSSFSVKPVKKYKPGYPVKGFFRRSFVIAVPIKLFSLLIVGMLFFITVPGCFEQEMKTDGVPLYDFDAVPDNETTDNEVADDIVPDEKTGDSDIPQNDYEPTDFDQIDGGAVPECLEDKDCDEGYYCDLTTYTCVQEMAGEPMPECLEDKDCDEGYYCDLNSYTCVEQLSGDPIPDQEVTDEASDETEVPDEELSGFAPPVLKK